MRRSGDATGSLTGAVALERRVIRRGRVAVFRHYRRRSRLRRWVETARLRIATLTRRLVAVPRTFWAGMLAGFLTAVVLMAATGHGGPSPVSGGSTRAAYRTVLKGPS
jgi:hypothetical protein